MKLLDLIAKNKAKNIDPEILVMVKRWYYVQYQNVQYAVIENQEAKGLLSNLGIRAPLSKVPMLGDILF